MNIHLVKTVVLTIILMASFSHVTADPESLTEADRIALAKELEKIQKRSQDRVSGLYRRAIKDYRAAIATDELTMKLYLKCVEKVRFKDQKFKAKKFREWKKKNKDRLGSTSMRMALRHQLAWLLLSIEAARQEGDISEMGKRAMTHLDQILKNAKVLKEHRGILGRDALSSVFARTYQLNIKLKDWPKSAMDIPQIYEKLVMPPLRHVTHIPSLRNAWKKRILHEGLVAEKWGETQGVDPGKKGALSPLRYEEFLKVKRPQLLWKMEMDCYRSGDQRASSLNMIKHLRTYISHKDAPEWIKAIQNLVNPVAEDEEVEAEIP